MCPDKTHSLAYERASECATNRGVGSVNPRIQDWRGTRSGVHLVSTIHSERFESRYYVRSSSFGHWCWGCPKPGDSTRFQILIGKRSEERRVGKEGKLSG